MTTKQQRELKCLRYFVLPLKTYALEENRRSLFQDQKGNALTITQSRDGISAEDAYFLITDQGTKKLITRSIKRLAQYLDAKRWRLRHIDWYEQSLLSDAPVPWVYFLKKNNGHKIPQEVFDFLARTLFKGIDREHMTKFYNSL